VDFAGSELSASESSLDDKDPNASLFGKEGVAAVGTEGELPDWGSAAWAGCCGGGA